MVSNSTQAAAVFDTGETGIIQPVPELSRPISLQPPRRSLFRVVCLQQRQEASATEELTR